MNFRELIRNSFFWVLSFLISVNVLFAFTFYLDAPNYEFSLFNSVLIFLLFGIYSISSLKNNNFKLYKGFVLIIAPLIISMISNLLSKNCPIFQNILFYFFTIIPTIILAFGLASVSNSIKYWEHKKYAEYLPYLIYAIFFIFIALESLVEFYFYPQVYLFNPIIGYFSGTIYDDKIDLTSTFLIYRAVILSFAVLIIYLSRSTKRKVLLSSLFIFYIIFFFFKPSFGFSTNSTVLKDRLGKVIETAHFRIIVPMGIDLLTTSYITREHEYFYWKYEKKFKENDNYPKIKSYVFRNNYEKRELFGAGNADVAKPWLRQIFTSLNGIDQTLEHELIHILAANYGSTILKISHGFNPYLLEGLPVALVNEINTRNIDYFAKMLRNNNAEFSIDNFNSMFSFFSVNSFISYIYAGSFIKYLIGEYGFAKVMQVYEFGDIEHNLDIDLNSLLSHFFEHLDSLQYKYKDEEFPFYFGRAPIYSRVCPRELALKLESAQKLFSDKKYNSSLHLYNEIFNLNHDPGALNGILINLKELSKFNDAIDMINKNISHFEKSNYNLFFKLKLADFMFLSSLQKDNSFNQSDSISVNIDSIRSLKNSDLNYKDEIKIRYEEIKNESPNFNYYISSLIREKFLDQPEILNEILTKGLDSLTHEKLSYSSEDDENDSLVQSYINLISNKNSNYEKVDWSAFTKLPYFEEFFLDFSDKLIKNENYSLAHKILTLAEKNIIRIEFLDKINENLKKIEWLTNFGSKIKFIENTSN